MSSENNSTPSSPDREVKYDLTTVRSVRGLEARTIAKWEKDGWEFVSQEVGKIQTQITFRRPKTPVPWATLAIIGGVLAVCAVVIVIGVSVSGGGSKEPEASSSPSASSVTEQTPASEAPAEPNEPVEPATEEILTVENSTDLAALLTGPSDGASVEQFVQTYAGRLIEFDGSIGAIAPHRDYNTRYDILVVFGDYSETHSSGGPSFQFRDVNTVSDLHYAGENVPDTIGVGQNVRIVARVGSFEPDSTLFLLEPVSTRFR